MLEIVLVTLACGAMFELARRRRVARAWPFAAMAWVGYFAIGFLATGLLGRGPDLLLRWTWLGLCSLAFFGLTGRRLDESWQCPDCRSFNEPASLVCPCGYRDPALGLREPPERSSRPGG